MQKLSTGPLRAGGLSMAGAAVNALAQLALTVVVTRTLPPAEAGRLFADFALFLLLTGIAQLGTRDGLVYFLGRGRAPGLWTALGPPLAASAGTSAVLVAAGAGPLAVFVPFAVLTEAGLAVTRGRGAMGPTAVIDGAIRPLLQLGAVASALQTGIDPRLAWGAPWTAALLILLIWWRPTRPQARASAVAPAAEFWRHTGPRGLAQGVQAAFQRLDILLIAWLAGPGAAAVYTAVSRFKVLGQLINKAIAQAVQPRLVAALAAADTGRARRLHRAATGVLIVLTWPVWIGLAAFAPEILAVFGPGYESGRAVAVVIALTMMYATACGIVDVILIASGRTVRNLAHITLALAVMVAVDILLIPSLGLLGGALGWSAGVIVKNALPLPAVRRILR